MPNQAMHPSRRNSRFPISTFFDGDWVNAVVTRVNNSWKGFEMSPSERCYYVLILIAIVNAAGCSPSQEQPPNESRPNDRVESSAIDQLAGVHYPKAVIRFRVGNESSQEVTEGLHFVNSKRESGRLTGVDVSGDEFVLSWDYLGSDGNSDNYQIALQLPSEQEPSQIRELQYSGEDSVTFYKSGRVAITIENSMDD
jgi:hypothetical protein